MIVRNEKYRESLLHSISEVEEKVNTLMKEGWRPFGGVEITGDTYGQFLLQAMVIEEKPEPIQKRTRKEKKQPVAKIQAILAAENNKKRMKKKEVHI
jgi:hypothetical protein